MPGSFVEVVDTLVDTVLAYQGANSNDAAELADQPATGRTGAAAGSDAQQVRVEVTARLPDGRMVRLHNGMLPQPGASGDQATDPRVNTSIANAPAFPKQARLYFGGETPWQDCSAGIPAAQFERFWLRCCSCCVFWEDLITSCSPCKLDDIARSLGYWWRRV